MISDVQSRLFDKVGLAKNEEGYSIFLDLNCGQRGRIKKEKMLL